MSLPFLTRLLVPARPIIFALPLGLALSSALFQRQPIHCDAPAPFSAAGHSQSSSSSSTWFQTANPVRSRGGISEKTAGQISLGSVLGLLAGIGLRIFSRALVFALGITILGIQWAASKGYNIVPTDWLKKHVKSVNVQRLLTEKAPFKVSFGVMMLLSAFAQF
ncbi:hypothetical protein PAAG_07325 [Paracoccidioides lutzii Pb01]|uniref:FUN14 family protein n=1 Tax=Paracoccidioides lutzii (strain ATCC MYA-826 / Pb01) TaxID=502779 RepID=C1H984_PARBA|nr:hypothetical protein PAAG_07325 [Paracoccidioides lutzii Pb01]EEH36907.1 hypothetical protein PAAG_07325 [Paracoccidioides lutzii Pb01]